jgi:hypothetical protein
MEQVKWTVPSGRVGGGAIGHEENDTTTSQFVLVASTQCESPVCRERLNLSIDPFEAG